MLRALIYLRLVSMRNGLWARVKRLRQPKYLVGAVVGGAYLWFFFIRIFFLPSTGPRLPGSAEEMKSLPLVLILIPIGLIAVGKIVAAWAAPTNKPGLAFTEPEIAFLFPAPATRRMLVHYKLLGTQFTILISASIFALISSQAPMLGGNYLTHAVGWWIMLSTLNLHSTAAAFTVNRLIEGGYSTRKRQAVVTALVLLFFAIAGYTLWWLAPRPTAADMDNPLTLLAYAARLTESGPLYWAVLPFRIVLGPFLAADWTAFWIALGPALLVLGAHYVWVMRSETAFEEGTIALAERRAQVIAAMQSGNYRLGQEKARARRAPFRLDPAGGRPEIAFLWKNLLSTRPYFGPRAFVILAALICLLGGVLSRAGDEARAGLALGGMFAGIAAVYAVFLGPQVARQDFRSDLINADLLKTYPLRGWQVAVGELLTPVAIVTGFIWLSLLAAGLGAGGADDWPEEITPGVIAGVGLCLAAIAPFLCTLQLIVPNLATLLFPSWARQGPVREHGFDVLGQRLLFVAGQVVVTFVALLPAGVAAFLLVFASAWILGPVGSAVVATGGVIVILGCEIAFGILWIGSRFERLDLSAERIR